MKYNICFHIGDITLTGGTERVTTNIVNTLKNYYGEKYNFFIMSNTKSNDTPYFKLDKSVKINYLYNKRYHFKLLYLLTLIKQCMFIKKNKIDLLISVDSFLSLIDIPTCKIMNIKNICWEHFSLSNDLGYKIRYKARRFAVKKSDAIVVLSDKDKTAYINEFGYLSKLKRIYNPMTILNTNNVEYKPGKNIISCGRFTKEKGYDLLVDVANLLYKRNIKFNWNILGDGVEKKNIQNMLDDYGLNDCVHLLGNKKNIEDYYKESNLFILTSKYEGFGLVLTEAQQFKLPVIAFDCDCGPAEIISNEENGYLVKCFDIEEMADKIEKLLENESLQIEFSNKSNIKLNEFNPKNISMVWNELIIELLINKN